MKRRNQTFRITKGGGSYISPAALADEIELWKFKLKTAKHKAQPRSGKTDTD